MDDDDLEDNTQQFHHPASSDWAPDFDLAPSHNNFASFGAPAPVSVATDAFAADFSAFPSTPPAPNGDEEVISHHANSSDDPFAGDEEVLAKEEDTA